MSESRSTAPKPLAGWRVLVPRGGPWGDTVAADLRAQGAQPVIAPMINFAPASDGETVTRALDRLAAGEYDWLTATSATIVDVLQSYRAVIPPATRVAAVGETTAAALVAAGYRVDFVPVANNSAKGLLAEWLEATGGTTGLRVLTLRSEIAKPTLTEGLTQMGFTVDAVVAYRTVGVPVDDRVVADVRAGNINAILVTSGSVAEQVAAQLAPIPEGTLIAAIGPQTAHDAREHGLDVHLIAAERSADSLIDAVVQASHVQRP
jgi:uroporphyrinogen-III synthase